MNLLERMFGFRIVRAHNVALIFEHVHLRRFFRHFQVDCVFDVGANVGQHATMLRRHTGYTGTIVSFEPVPRFADVLRRKAKLDGNWYVENVAIDSSAGEQTFYVMKHDGFSSLHEPCHAEVDIFRSKNVVSEQLTVQTVTLAAMYEKYAALLGFSRPFLKMDTQGHDLAIARGSSETLHKFVGLQSELSIRALYKDTPRYADVIEYYRSQGFELSAFVPNNAGHFPHLVEVDCVMYNTLSLPRDKLLASEPKAAPGSRADGTDEDLPLETA
jgi:FkbM family methyltransferase